MEQEALRYEQAAALLPSRLRRLALAVPQAEWRQTEEFRLRAGRPFSVLLRQEERVLGEAVTPEDIETLCDLASDFSRYAAMETIKDGFLSVRGGFRVGLCGTAVMKDGANTNLKDLSSAVIRLSREERGIGRDVAGRLFSCGCFLNTLLLSPPGGGKTTLLRDLVRCLSDGEGIERQQRVALIDERGEIAVMYRGQPQFDVGGHTDVLDGCPKALGITMALRAMNPTIIAVDEITAKEDIRGAMQAAGCGVGLLATVHAKDSADLRRRPLYRALLEEGIFQVAVCIERQGAQRRYRVEALT